MSYQTEDFMARRKIKRRRGEGISISGPATVHVSRGVTLVIDAPDEARIARLKRLARRAAVHSGSEQKAGMHFGKTRRQGEGETRR